MTRHENRDDELNMLAARRRAGLRPDEVDPDAPRGEPGSAAGEVHAQGTPGGGTSEGGLGGTNLGAGGAADVDLEDNLGTGIHDDLGNEEEREPQSGHAGGAVGGTPVGKRASGDNIHRGVSPGGSSAESTVGQPPTRKPK
jgi:hypothetical protein